METLKSKEDAADPNGFNKDGNTTNSSVTSKVKAFSADKDYKKKSYNPVKFFQGMVLEIKLSVWPSPKKALNSVAVVSLVLLSMTLLVFLLDIVSASLLETSIRNALTVSFPYKGFLEAFQVGSMFFTLFTLFRQPPPSGSGGLFGSEGGDVSPPSVSRFRNRLTLVAAVLFVVSSTLLAFFG